MLLSRSALRKNVKPVNISATKLMSRFPADIKVAEHVCALCRADKIPSINGRGFVYLAAVVDWFSRRVLSYRLSITMEAAFCIEALEEALARHGEMSRLLLNIEKRSLPRLMLSGVGLASKDTV